METSMMMDNNSEIRRKRTARILAIPIFCGVFSFCHWFIFFPLMWKYLSNHGMERFWLFALIVFLMWLVIMALCLCFWCHDKKRLTPVERYTTGLRYDSNVGRDSPSFKTKSCIIQPNSKVMSSGEFDSEKDVLCMRSIPVQPQNTPSLYNLHTGRHSYDSGDIRNSSDSFRTSEQYSREVLLVRKENNLKFTRTSSSDSDHSSKGILNEHRVSSELPLILEKEKKSNEKIKGNHTVEVVIEKPVSHEQNIQLRTKYDRCAVAQQPTKVRLSSGSDENYDLFKHIDMDVRLSDEHINSRISKSQEIEHLQDGDNPNADNLSENMPEFDDYLHLVSIETPLSPREIFFGDLIKQANEAEQKLLQGKESSGGDRRSYCLGDITYTKLNYDHRKSMPLFLYSDQWRKDQTGDAEDVPEQNVDSDDNQELDQGAVKPPDIERNRPFERKATDLKIIEMSPKVKDCDVKMITEMFIKQEKLNSHPPFNVHVPLDTEPLIKQCRTPLCSPQESSICIDSPTDNDNEELKIATQMLINEEKLKACVSSLVAKLPPENEGPKFKNDIEEFDSTYKPRFPKDKPLKLTEFVKGQVTEPKENPAVVRKEAVVEPLYEKSQARPGCCEHIPKGVVKLTENKRKSSSEYFIADIEPRAPQSVTSEVFLTVGASGLVTNVPEVHGQEIKPGKSGNTATDLGKWSAEGKQGMVRELSQDKLDYKSEDDDVFEDVQTALNKIRRHK